MKKKINEIEFKNLRRLLANMIRYLEVSPGCKDEAEVADWKQIEKLKSLAKKSTEFLTLGFSQINNMKDVKSGTDSGVIDNNADAITEDDATYGCNGEKPRIYS